MNIDAEDTAWTIKTKFEDTKRAQKFKYLGETLTPIVNDTAEVEERAKL